MQVLNSHPILRPCLAFFSGLDYLCCLPTFIRNLGYGGHMVIQGMSGKRGGRQQNVEGLPSNSAFQTGFSFRRGTIFVPKCLAEALFHFREVEMGKGTG